MKKLEIAKSEFEKLGSEIVAKFSSVNVDDLNDEIRSSMIFISMGIYSNLNALMSDIESQKQYIKNCFCQEKEWRA